MAVIRSKAARFTSAISAAVIVACMSYLATNSWAYAPLAAWDGFVMMFLWQIWRDFYRHDAKATAEIARRDELSRSASDIVLIVASLVSLGAVVWMLATPSRSLLVVAFALANVLLSWALVHAVYMLKYAVMYYDEEKDSIDFGDEKDPTFSDFAYTAYTIGMTYQVSDTTFGSTRLRRSALGHALLSFVFGVAIIAVSINFVASLAK